MSRRRRPEKREILPDPKFGDLVLSKFMNNLMLDGKKSTAERIVYSALDTVEAKAKADPIQMFHDALNNIKPQVEVRACAGAGDPLADLGRARSCRDHHERAPFGRADGCGEQSRQRGQEARRYAPHGGCEPRLLALPLVRHIGWGAPALRRARLYPVT